MKLETISGSENYTCTVVEIKNLFDIPGADRLKRTNVLGNDVVVGLDTKVGDKYIYFCSGTKLSPEYCRFNNLLTDKEQNRDKTVSGYISHKQFRVKAIKLKSVISDGILLPLSSIWALDNVNLVEFKVGDTFTTINGFKLCEKYVVPSARNSGTGVPKVKEKFRLTDIMIPGQFKFHKDTAHLARSISRLQEDDLYVITAKVHGCLPSFQPIKMLNGETKKIIHIKVGDYVLGFCHKDKEYKGSKVLAISSNGKTDTWLKIRKTYNSLRRSAFVETLFCTDTHKIYDPISDTYKMAKDLIVGDYVYSYRSQFEFSELQEQFLIGKILGDGSVDKHNKKWALGISQKETHSDYLHLCRNVCKDLFTDTIDRRISGYGTNMVRSRTKQDIAFNILYDRFLNEDLQKVFPENLVLTPIMLAYWYMDDGSLSHSEVQKDRAAIAICTYKERDIENIKWSLNNFGFNNYSIFFDTRGYLRLRFNHSDAYILFDNIAPYIPESMRYKLPKEYRDVEYIDITGSPLKTVIKPVMEQIVSIDSVLSGTSHLNSNKYDIETETGNYLSGGMLIHNSSIILSRVLGVRKLSLKDKIAKFFGARVAETEFVDIWSSGKPKSNLPKGISSGWTNSNSSYYKEDVWKIAYNDHKHTLEKGITLYGEIIGSHIQGGFDYTKLLIPEKNYGLYIYRITQTNEDGITYEFTWDQIKAYCNKYELKHVPEIEYGFKSQLAFNIEEPDGTYFEDQCKYCLNKVPNEGICVRNDKTFEVFKHKNPLFLLKEDKNLEEGITNIEDNQDEQN